MWASWVWSRPSGGGSSWACGTPTPPWGTSWAPWSPEPSCPLSGGCPSSCPDSSSPPPACCASSSWWRVSSQSLEQGLYPETFILKGLVFSDVPHPVWLVGEAVNVYAATLKCWNDYLDQSKLQLYFMKYKRCVWGSDEFRFKWLFYLLQT